MNGDRNTVVPATKESVLVLVTQAAPDHLVLLPHLIEDVSRNYGVEHGDDRNNRISERRFVGLLKVPVEHEEHVVPHQTNHRTNDSWSHEQPKMGTQAISHPTHLGLRGWGSGNKLQYYIKNVNLSKLSKGSPCSVI